MISNSKRQIMIYNEKKKLIANWDANMSIAWYIGAGVSIPLAIVAILVNTDLPVWRTVLILSTTTILTILFTWAGARQFRKAVDGLSDLKAEDDHT